MSIKHGGGTEEETSGQTKACTSVAQTKGVLLASVHMHVGISEMSAYSLL